MRGWATIGVAVGVAGFLFLFFLRSHPPLLAAIGGGSVGLLVALTGLSLRRLHRELTTPSFTVEAEDPPADPQPSGDDARGS